MCLFYYTKPTSYECLQGTRLSASRDMELNLYMLNPELCTEESFVVSVRVLYFSSVLTKISCLFVSHDSTSIFGFHQ